MKFTLAKIALAGTSVLVSLVLAESAARFLIRPAPYVRSPQVRYDAHPVRTFTLRPCQNDVYTLSETAEVDCRGFRVHADRTLGEQNDRNIQIIGLGDSFTFGLGVAGDRTWPAQLEAILRSTSRPNISVLNAGTVSYGVYQQLDHLNEILEFTDPEWVVHALYWNDYQSAHPPEPGAEGVLTPGGHFIWNVDSASDSRDFARETIGWLSARSALMTATRRTMMQLWKSTEPSSGYAGEYARFLRGDVDPDDLAPIEDFYAELQGLQEKHGFLVLVVLLPVHGFPDETPQRSRYRSWARSLVESHGFDFIDGFGIFESAGRFEDLFLGDGGDPHLNDDGYRLLSTAMAKILTMEAGSRRLPVE